MFPFTLETGRKNQTGQKPGVAHWVCSHSGGGHLHDWRLQLEGTWEKIRPDSSENNSGPTSPYPIIRSVWNSALLL